MRMSDDDKRHFRKLAYYVRVNIPQVINVPKIVKNLKKFGNLTTTEIRHALTWGNLPLIMIKDLSNFQCSVQSANGCFDPANPGQVELDTGRAQEFEDDAYRGRQRPDLRRPQGLHRGNHPAARALPRGELPTRGCRDRRGRHRL